MPYYNDWGNDKTYPHYSIGWAWTFCTPYRWTKQIASYFGGTKNGMAIMWPEKIKDKGGIRWQFHHVVDIVPTLLEVTGISVPVMVDGVSQRPIEGVSMAYTFDQNAGGFNAVSRHHTQYFEMASVYGLYSDGWMLSAEPKRAPWQLTQAAISNPASAYQLELFDLGKDWTQYTDLSAQYPQKVQEMKDMLFGEFAKYQVLPLDASAATRFVTPRPSLSAGRTVFNYSGVTTTDIPVGNMPSLLNSSYTITAEIEVLVSNAQGMLINEGGRYGGWGMYLLKGKPVFTYNFLGIKTTKWQGPALSPGKHTIEFDFKYDGLGSETLVYNNLSGIGKGGIGTLKVDGKVVSTQKMDQTLPLTKHMDDVYNIGDASGTPVDDKDYQIPFKFTGKIKQLTITVDRPKLSQQDIQKIQEAEHKSKLNN
jgi:arylsulfatase